MSEQGETIEDLQAEGFKFQESSQTYKKYD
jgi:hypothetical protein